MMYNILTGAGFGIFAGHTFSVNNGMMPLFIAFCCTVAGYLLNMRLSKFPVAEFFASAILLIFRAILFTHPVPELLPAVGGLLCGMMFYCCGNNKSSLGSAAVTGIVTSAAVLLLPGGSGEACLALICGGAALSAAQLRHSKNRKLAILTILMLLFSLFPAGTASKLERMKELSNALKLSDSVTVAMTLPGTGVATEALVIGSFGEQVASGLKDFAGLKQVKVIKNYAQLYPVFDRKEQRRTYPVVFVTGSGRMCRLGSNLVSRGGILIVPVEHVQEVPSAFRHWSELPDTPGFVVMARDFVIDCSGSTIERKMQLHMKKCGFGDTVPKGVYDAVFSSENKPAGGIREIDSIRQINYTLWFFGLISGAYLILRLVIFSRFDKGERRWSALENTASTILLFLLLKRTPDTLCTALLPAAAFLMLPVVGFTGKKWRVLQLATVVLAILSIYEPQFINACQLVGAICCGVMWNHLRQEKGAVIQWVDSCSLCGTVAGTGLFMLLLTFNAPTAFILGVVLLLRSNALFRSL